MKNKFLSFLLVLVFLCVAVLVGAFFFLRLQAAPYKAVSADSEAIKIEVPPGATMRTVAKELAEKKIIKNADVFYLAARFPIIRYLTSGNTEAVSLKKGSYEVNGAMSYAELFALFTNGADDYVRVTIPEGYTISMIARILDDSGVCDFSAFVAAAHDPGLIASYNIASTSLEGYLFPDTYFLAPNMAAEKICETMLDNFFSHVKEFAEVRDFSPEQLDSIVTLASIVEGEYKVADEAPLIASVFKNRINKKMGLFSCATIVYIITEIQGKPHPDIVTYEDLKIDSPYNTYKWAALPPTPISNPGSIALQAVFDTPETEYMYFRVTDPQAGRHVFTTNYEDHLNEGKLYTKKR